MYIYRISTVSEAHPFSSLIATYYLDIAIYWALHQLMNWSGMYLDHIIMFLVSLLPYGFCDVLNRDQVINGTWLQILFYVREDWLCIGGTNMYWISGAMIMSIMNWHHIVLVDEAMRKDNFGEMIRIHLFVLYECLSEYLNEQNPAETF